MTNDDFMPEDDVQKLLCNDGEYRDFPMDDRINWANQIKKWTDAFTNRTLWYAIDEKPFGNPRETPKWRIQRVTGGYVWGGPGFATFDEARLHVIEQIRIWRETYGKTRIEAHQRFQALGLSIPEEIRAMGFKIGFDRSYQDPLRVYYDRMAVPRQEKETP